jgi:hypothetical protein
MADDSTTKHMEKSVHTVYFKGTKKDFKMWSARFMCCAHLKSPNTKKVLIGLLTVPKESEALNSSTPRISAFTGRPIIRPTTCFY